MPSDKAKERAIYKSLVYPRNGVLRNKLNITKPAVLRRCEAQAVILREPTRPRFVHFTLAETQAVHRHLLSDVYEWAGNIRPYTTGRGAVMSFTLPRYIESEFESLVSRPLQCEGFLRGSSRAQFVERSAYFANQVNAIHPFIDGNGRITRLLLKDLAVQAGYDLDIIRLAASSGAWYAAMKKGFERGNTSRLKEEIQGALVDVRKKA